MARQRTARAARAGGRRAARARLGRPPTIWPRCRRRSVFASNGAARCRPSAHRWRWSAKAWPGARRLAERPRARAVVVDQQTVELNGTATSVGETAASAPDRFPIDVVCAADARPAVDAAIAAVRSERVWAPTADRHARLVLIGTPVDAAGIADARPVNDAVDGGRHRMDCERPRAPGRGLGGAGRLERCAIQRCAVAHAGFRLRRPAAGGGRGLAGRPDCRSAVPRPPAWLRPLAARDGQRDGGAARLAGGGSAADPRRAASGLDSAGRARDGAADRPRRARRPARPLGAGPRSAGAGDVGAARADGRPRSSRTAEDARVA